MVYNAGSDILIGDPLGKLDISPQVRQVRVHVHAAKRRDTHLSRCGASLGTHALLNDNDNDRGLGARILVFRFFTFCAFIPLAGHRKARRNRVHGSKDAPHSPRHADFGRLSTLKRSNHRQFHREPVREGHYHMTDEMR